MKSIYLLIAILVLLFSVIFLLYKGFNTLPSEGDSLGMHIPIAESILTGDVFHPDINEDIFYPASTELILAIFILLSIPLNLFNVLGMILIFISSIVLGFTVGLSRKMALWFALTIFFLNGISRWAFTQKPDILMLFFLILILITCFKKKLYDKDYLILGVASGFFIGSKFTGVLILFFIVIFFYKRFLKNINLKKIIYFLIPFILFGLIWYLRNYLIAGSPLYFQGYSVVGDAASYGLLTWPGWKSIIYFPQNMINAFISEFMLWTLAFILVPIFILVNRGNQVTREIKKLVYISLLFLLVYLFLPVSDNLTQTIGSIRYILPSGYLIILAAFMIGKKYDMNNLIINISFTNIFIILLPVYYPKLVFPLFLILILIEVTEKVFYRKFVLNTK